MKHSERWRGQQRWRTTEERDALMEQFHRSGLSRKVFARREGIALSTLCYWLRKEEPKRLKKESLLPVVFNELRLNAREMDSGSDSGWALEIVTREGLTIRSREGIPAEILIRLLKKI